MTLKKIAITSKITIEMESFMHSIYCRESASGRAT